MTTRDEIKEEDYKSQVIVDKLDFYLEKNIKIHIKKLDGTFWNGTLISKLRDGIYIVQERKLGRAHLFVRDVVSVEEFEEKS